MNWTMTDQVAIRPAEEDGIEFVAGFVPTLLEFGSPAWEDVDAMARGFRQVLARAVSAQDPRSTVLIAEAADGTPLAFIWGSPRDGHSAVRPW